LIAQLHEASRIVQEKERDGGVNGPSDKKKL